MLLFDKYLVCNLLGILIFFIICKYHSMDLELVTYIFIYIIIQRIVTE